MRLISGNYLADFSEIIIIAWYCRLITCVGWPASEPIMASMGHAEFQAMISPRQVMPLREFLHKSRRHGPAGPRAPAAPVTECHWANGPPASKLTTQIMSIRVTQAQRVTVHRDQLCLVTQCFSHSDNSLTTTSTSMKSCSPSRRI